MPESPTRNWQCPSCGRRVPATVDACRCGLGRDNTEVRRQQFEASRASAAAARPASPAQAFARAMIGYRADVNVPRGVRVGLKALFVAAIVFASAASTLTMTRGGGAEPQPTIQILSRLDEFTKTLNASTRNSIPAFLALPGKLGALEPPSATETGKPADAAPAPVSAPAIKDINEGELQKGICSASVPVLVRQQYPGSYDTWPDAKLEEIVLEKHPEYRDRVCILPAWIDAAPHDIVKYESKPAPPRGLDKRALLGMTLIPLGLAFVSLNAYYRLIVGRF